MPVSWLAGCSLCASTSLARKRVPQSEAVLCRIASRFAFKFSVLSSYLNFSLSDEIHPSVSLCYLWSGCFITATEAKLEWPVTRLARSPFHRKSYSPSRREKWIIVPIYDKIMDLYPQKSLPRVAANRVSAMGFAYFSELLIFSFFLFFFGRLVQSPSLLSLTFCVLVLS